MKIELIQFLAETAERISKLSHCSRRGVGAVLATSAGNVISMGYNGTTPGASNLCGGHVCARDAQGVPSGTRLEIGCTHAEQNVIGHAAAAGISTMGAWLFVNTAPCLACAKLIVSAGITRVVLVVGNDAGRGAAHLDGGHLYAGLEGLDHLRDSGVVVSRGSAEAIAAGFA